MKKWVIARPINGISINGDDGKYVCFDTEQEAKDAMIKAYPAILIIGQGMYVKEIEIDEGDTDE